MIFFTKLKAFIQSYDLFYTKELLRYKSESEYKTFFGGFISVLIYIALAILFTVNFIQVINKTNIIVSSKESKSSDLAPLDLSTFPQGKFMFGVGIQALQLGDRIRMFDVYLKAETMDLDAQDYLTEQYYPLEPCTLSHWADFPQLHKDLQNLSMQDWLCSPKDKIFPIQGKYGSQIYQRIQLGVKPCTNSFDRSKPCMVKQDADLFLDLLKNLHFKVYFTNPLINPSDQNYLSYYIQDSNYISFSKDLSGKGVIYFGEYEINTDQSLLPFQSIKQEKGAIVSQLAIKDTELYNKLQTMTPYAVLRFEKSGTKFVYQRSYQKLDIVFSYIGGLLGTITLFLFLVSDYNSNSYEINLASNFFKVKQNQQQNVLKKYNFLHFIKQSFYGFISIFGFKPSWKSSQIIQECQQEIAKHMDILELLKRVWFLQKTIQFLVENHQLVALQLQQRPTVQEARSVRKSFKIKRQFLKEILKLKQKNKKNAQEKVQSQKNLNGKIKDSYIIQNISENKLEQSKNSINIILSGIVDQHLIGKKQVGQNIVDFEDVDISSNQSEGEDQTEVEDIEEKSQNTNPNFGKHTQKISLLIQALKSENNKGGKQTQQLWQKVDPQIKKLFNHIQKEKSIQFKKK